MKLKLNILFKSAGLLITIVVFIIGIINVVSEYPANLNYIAIILSCVTFAFYIAEWFVTRAWFRIPYWLAFVIINPIMMMEKHQEKMLRNINASMFIFSIFYLIIMIVSITVLIYTALNKKKESKQI